MSLAGPTLIGVDQIDGVVNPSIVAVHVNDDAPNQGLGETLAAGLLELYDVSNRSMTVITCLFDSWQVLKDRGLVSFSQRFQEPVVLRGMNDPTGVRDLIVSRLTPTFAAAHFKPPFASWPFSEAAIASAASVAMMPRTILMRCDAFRRRCIDASEMSVCDRLTEAVTPVPAPAARNGFAQDFQRLCAAADVSGLIAPGDDGEFRALS
jgi:hypothetical protein